MIKEAEPGFITDTGLALAEDAMSVSAEDALSVSADETYQDALALLQSLTVFGIEPSLEGVTELMHWLGDPQQKYSCIQIAGTNGKTSTARFTAAFLHSQGMKVGLYTSPELVEYRERMEINGEVVSEQCFAAAILTAWEATSRAVDAGVIWGVTEFELVTAAALWLFAREQVDFAVLEVGLGGRWDATSVVSPKVAVITGIGLDHMAILGDTIEKIAAEKAAIIKAGCIPILGPGTADTREVFRARCDEVGVAPIIVEDTNHCEGLRIDLLRFPSYQKPNIACALTATSSVIQGPSLPLRVNSMKNLSSDSLDMGAIPNSSVIQSPSLPLRADSTKDLPTNSLDMNAIQKALDTLIIPGRFELLREQPPLLIDASHNPQSAQVLADALRESYGTDEATGYLRGFDTLLLGVLADKDAKGIIDALAPLFKKLAVTQSSSQRAIPVEELASRVRQITGRNPEVFLSVGLALEALSNRDAAVVATGSITVAGEAKSSSILKVK